LKFNAKDINEFLKRDQDNKLIDYLKSHDIPKEKEENNVTVIVGKNFKEEIKGKNVFVFF